MKTRTILLACLAIFLVSAQAAMVHPGTRSASRFELDFVKAKIAAQAEPWTSQLAQAKAAGSDSRALGLALDWYLTGNESSANAAIAELKTWNAHAPFAVSPDNGGTQDALEGAWAGSVLAPAAEILSQYPGWSEADKTATQNMFRTVFLPAMLKMSYWNGNVDLTQIDALLSISVFLDDQASFDAGIERLKKRLPAYFYLSSDAATVRAYGNGTYNWGKQCVQGNENTNGCAPVKWVNGISQETCRDNGHHTQFAIAAALSALETAYLQGVDLYTPHQERMVAAMELLALQLSSRDMQGTCTINTTTNRHGDDDRYNTLEIGYNHYHNRKGIALPETWKEIQQELRTSGRQQFNMFHETLTNGDIFYPDAPASNSRKPNLPASRSDALNLSVQGGVLALNVAPKTQVQIRLVNLLGSPLQTLFAGEANGSLNVIWDDALPQGLYILQVRAGRENAQLLVSALDK